MGLPMILLGDDISSLLSKEAHMLKKYIVRLSDQEREQLAVIVRKFSGTSQKVRRAQILLKADVDGPGWPDQRIADAFGCRRQTVENVRQRLVEDGFDIALNGLKRENPPIPKMLDGKQEAKVIAMRLGKPPAGYAHWTLRLLARKVVELSIAPSISHETIRRTLKKMA
jgi:biotin operon repressor